ncbi:MAG: ABC transporter ATP-binding protein [Acidobacteria bacterium]|nr:MAG: ABC transporter ATP-binding protein [Acidobacteriota bacterium]
MTNAIIEAVGLTKQYRNGIRALDNVNMTVLGGQVFCLLGPNGAGKTTLVNLFLNFISPTAGEARVKGIDCHKHPTRAKRNLAYVPEKVALYGNFSARENLEFFTQLGGVRHLTRKDYYRALSEAGLPERTYEQPARQFSKGLTQKLAIAIALARNSDAVFLDEPTSGLDPKAIDEFERAVRQLKTHGKAVLLTTHDLLLTARLADNVGIMRDGKLVLQRTAGEIRKENMEMLNLVIMGDLFTQ